MKQFVLVMIALSLGLGACGSAHQDAEDAVRRRQKDPDATQFRDLMKCPKDPRVTSGEYNAKNSYGAYIGFEAFYHSQDTGVVFLSDDDFMMMLDRCYGKSKTDTGSEPQAMSVEQTMSDARQTASVRSSPNSDSEDDAEPPQAMCLADYCPCDTSDPDYGGADVTICRNLENGVLVENDLFAAAAGMRDARRQLREFNASDANY